MYCFPEDALVDSQLNQSRPPGRHLRPDPGQRQHRRLQPDRHARPRPDGRGPVDVLAPLEAVRDGNHRRRLVAAALVPRRGPALGFPGGEIELDLSLANEDVLSAGPVHGKRRHRRPRGLALATVGRSCRSRAVGASGGPGAHGAGHDRRRHRPLPVRRVPRQRRGAGGRPRSTIEVIGRPAPLTPRRRAAALGLRRAECVGWLGAHGLDIVVGERSSEQRRLLLVGHAGELDDDHWQALNAAVDRGATAVVLSPWELIEPGETSVALPFGGADFLHELSRLALPQGMLRQGRRILSTACRPGSHGLAVLRCRPSSSLAARGRRRGGGVRHRHRVPMPWGLRFRPAGGELPPRGGAESSSVLSTCWPTRVLGRGRPVDGQPPAFRHDEPDPGLRPVRVGTTI